MRIFISKKINVFIKKASFLIDIIPLESKYYITIILKEMKLQ